MFLINSKIKDNASHFCGSFISFTRRETDPGYSGVNTERKSTHWFWKMYPNSILTKKIAMQWWLNIIYKESCFNFLFSCYYVHIMLLSSKTGIVFKGSSSFTKIKFGCTQISVPKIIIPVLKTACINPCYFELPQWSLWTNSDHCFNLIGLLRERVERTCYIYFRKCSLWKLYFLFSLIYFMAKTRKQYFKNPRTVSIIHLELLFHGKYFSPNSWSQLKLAKNLPTYCSNKNIWH